jgi:NodT family efflux transporter outer membrane factor (OMF) lipoprotein
MRTDTGEAAIAQRFTDRPENRRRSLVTWILVLAVLAVMASGCTTVGPDFVKPEAPTLADWNEMQAPGFNAGQADYSSWWQAFDDPVLHELVERAYRQNLSLQIAGIRIYEARAQLGIAVGNLYPQQQMGFGELRANKLGQASNTFLASENFNSLRLGFDASWEMDIWGKYRRSVQSGLANLAATVASYDNMLVSLTAEVARNYIVIRTFEKRLAIAEQNIKLQKDSLRIAEVRFDNGAVSELDVTQARSLLKDTQASVPRLASGLRQAQNALAILLGVLPGTIAEHLAGPADIPTASEAVVIDIPNNLLRRRPDIRLSELQIAAQSPQIGIAKADLYPHFYLLGTLGWHSTDVDDSRRWEFTGGHFQLQKHVLEHRPQFQMGYPQLRTHQKPCACRRCTLPAARGHVSGYSNQCPTRGRGRDGGVYPRQGRGAVSQRECRRGPAFGGTRVDPVQRGPRQLS